MLRFWRALVAQLNIKYKLFTAYYPQTDKQTEHINQTLEQYLRYFYNYQQTNQVKLLLIAMLAYNTSKHSITKRVLFFINKGFEADVLLETKRCKELVPHTVIKVEKIYKL